MINSIDHFLSQAAMGMKRSAIREILKLLQKPGMISFAGGLPSPETFPVMTLKRLLLKYLKKRVLLLCNTVRQREILFCGRCWSRDITDRV